MIARIPRIQGGADVTLTGEATRSSSTSQKPWSRPPISVDFNVLMFTSSGLLVRFLKVFEAKLGPSFQSVKWVRYLTKANGTYQIRVRSFHLSAFCASGLIGLYYADLTMTMARTTSTVVLSEYERTNLSNIRSFLRSGRA